MTTQILSCKSILRAAAGSVVLLFALASRAGDCPHDDFARLPIFPPGSYPYGASYAEWSERWWQWSFSFPASADPELGTAAFDDRQSGPVWFIPTPFNGATLTRVGTIPEGTALFGPILTTWWDNTGCPSYSDNTAAQLLDLVRQNWSGVTATSCSIDGVAVPDMQDPQNSPFLVFSQPFAYKLASTDNVLANFFGEPCIPDGTVVFPAIAGGVYVMIAPLPVGHHTIHFGAVVGPASNPDLTFDVTFDITVTRRHDCDGPKR